MGNIAIGDERFDVFMLMSASLTGFSFGELNSTGLSKDYYSHICNSDMDKDFYDVLDIGKKSIEWKGIAQCCEFNLEEFERLASHRYRNILDGIVKIWYLGTWNSEYVNDSSYKESLIWKAIETHPPGAKQPGFKSWSLKPEGDLA